uniref:GT23 domain-containing protein n=1 Tax=Mucochytrium quahogii TaxID=96639 RepID=A0A7S2SM59_9STRA|mmetsp:Transcript_16115/g.26319  ORF Transcript_16115/g.26319 Transcript_16115/m.26319 type:complete len:704 (+) Transcript_16115:578-2689(+)
MMGKKRRCTITLCVLVGLSIFIRVWEAGLAASSRSVVSGSSDVSSTWETNIGTFADSPTWTRGLESDKEFWLDDWYQEPRDMSLPFVAHDGKGVRWKWALGPDYDSGAQLSACKMIESPADSVGLELSDEDVLLRKQTIQRIDAVFQGLFVSERFPVGKVDKLRFEVDQLRRKFVYEAVRRWRLFLDTDDEIAVSVCGQARYSTSEVLDDAVVDMCLPICPSRWRSSLLFWLGARRACGIDPAGFIDKVAFDFKRSCTFHYLPSEEALEIRSRLDNTLEVGVRRATKQVAVYLKKSREWTTANDDGSNTPVTCDVGQSGFCVEMNKAVSCILYGLMLQRPVSIISGPKDPLKLSPWVHRYICPDSSRAMTGSISCWFNTRPSEDAVSWRNSSLKSFSRDSLCNVQGVDCCSIVEGFGSTTEKICKPLNRRIIPTLASFGSFWSAAVVTRALFDSIEHNARRRIKGVKRTISAPLGRKPIGVHIRAGDNCAHKTMDSIHQKNKCPPPDVDSTLKWANSTYFTIVRRLYRRYNATAVFVATDNEIIAKHIDDLCLPTLRCALLKVSSRTVLTQSFKERLVYVPPKPRDINQHDVNIDALLEEDTKRRSKEARHGEEFWIESKALRGEAAGDKIALETIAMVEVLASCSILVGSLLSHVDTVALQLAAAKQHNVPPFVFVSPEYLSGVKTMGNGAWMRSDGFPNLH